MNKFSREKRSSLMGHTEVVFTEMGSDFTITANGVGITLSGKSLEWEVQADLEDFAKVVTDAWKEHIKLKNCLRKKLMAVSPNVPGQ